MTQTSPSERMLNEYDYQFLTGTWEGVAGAAYNQTYEFCKEFGWCDYNGKPTSAGLEAIKAYEMGKWNL
jgi:hypothetical protein